MQFTVPVAGIYNQGRVFRYADDKNDIVKFHHGKATRVTSKRANRMDNKSLTYINLAPYAQSDDWMWVCGYPEELQKFLQHNGLPVEALGEAVRPGSNGAAHVTVPSFHNNVPQYQGRTTSLTTPPLASRAPRPTVYQGEQPILKPLTSLGQPLMTPLMTPVARTPRAVPTTFQRKSLDVFSFKGFKIPGVVLENNLKTLLVSFDFSFNTLGSEVKLGEERIKPRAFNAGGFGTINLLIKPNGVVFPGLDTIQGFIAQQVMNRFIEAFGNVVHVLLLKDIGEGTYLGEVSQDETLKASIFRAFIGATIKDSQHFHLPEDHRVLAAYHTGLPTDHEMFDEYDKNAETVENLRNLISQGLDPMELVEFPPSVPDLNQSEVKASPTYDNSVVLRDFTLPKYRQITSAPASATPSPASFIPTLGGGSTVPSPVPRTPRSGFTTPMVSSPPVGTNLESHSNGGATGTSPSTPPAAPPTTGEESGLPYFNLNEGDDVGGEGGEGDDVGDDDDVVPGLGEYEANE